jgi:hypothetical protein
MKIAGQEYSVERAYDVLAADAALVDKLEVTPEESESLVTYATLRSHNDYLRDLEATRRGY